MVNTKSKEELRSHLSKERSRLFVEFVVKSWWLILFFLICLFAYDQASRRCGQEVLCLQKKLDQIYNSKQEALILQEELKRVLASQSDPSWLELVLMQKLGLVPEGQTKVLFLRK